jgi:hypothetical protein
MAVLAVQLSLGVSCTYPHVPCLAVPLRMPGTSLRYRPGIIICGSGLVHDCGSSRSIGYFLEVLVLLALFAKRVSSSSSSTLRTARPSWMSVLTHTTSVGQQHVPGIASSCMLQ